MEQVSLRQLYLQVLLAWQVLLLVLRVQQRAQLLASPGLPLVQLLALLRELLALLRELLLALRVVL